MCHKWREGCVVSEEKRVCRKWREGCVINGKKGMS